MSCLALPCPVLSCLTARYSSPAPAQPSPFLLPSRREGMGNRLIAALPFPRGCETSPIPLFCRANGGAWHACVRACVPTAPRTVRRYVQYFSFFSETVRERGERKKKERRKERSIERWAQSRADALRCPVAAWSVWFRCFVFVVLFSWWIRGGFAIEAHEAQAGRDGGG